MYDIDDALAEICLSLGVVYTRYADDMTFSVSRRDVLSEVKRKVYEVIRGAAYPDVVVNDVKTVKYFDEKTSSGYWVGNK